MYPVPPESHRPKNRYGILVVALILLLLLLFQGLRSLSRSLNNLATGESSLPLFSQPRPGVTPLALAAPSAAPTLVPTPATTTVTAQELATSAATYRSRAVRVAGTVYYVGLTSNGRHWVQIVSGGTYVNGISADPWPLDVRKGAVVTITGIGAGLNSITAADGKQYQQPYIDPVQKIELGDVTSSSISAGSASPLP
ncbi:MAG TPA: hypothetical protein VMV93_06015 [Chloroflexota bacterium]|nr:hypothetical protein [Chloroflexota bacterium]